MKKVFLFFVKLAVSGILALTALNIFSLIYYNLPRAVPQGDKYTNTRYEPNSSWSFMTEGFGNGRINSLGYNSEELDSNSPMIAFIGSSHTEAFEVSQEKNFVSLTQKKLYGDDDPENDIQCQNFGVAGHFFNISASNLEYFAKAFDNTQHVVIETHNLYFSAEQLEKMLNGEYHKDLGPRGTLYTLAQKIPYLRLMNKQYQDLASRGSDSDSDTQVDLNAYREGMNKVLKKLSGIANEDGFKLTVLYHNWVKLDDSTVPYRGDDLEVREIFKECCEENGIYFVDPTESFIEHYKESNELPYGFANTTPGSGHLNVTGHKLVSETLYSHFCEIEEDK